MNKFVIILLSIATACFALYEEQTEPARVLGMGSAVVAAGEGVSAVPFNPAIGAGIERYSLSGTYSSRWSLEGFTEYSASFAVPTRYVNIVAGWHERSVVDVYGERTASLIFARNVVGKLDAGIAVKLFMTSAPGAETWADPTYDGPKYNLCADLGILYSPSPKWRFGLATRSLGDPDIQLLESTENPDSPGKQLAFGAAWAVAEDFTLAADIVSDEGDLHRWTPRVGMEIEFFDVLSVRAGSKGEHLALGAGLESKNWAFDVGLTNHRWLGNIYRFTIALSY